MTHKQTGIWAVVPAAGKGSRMGGDVPKQYLPLAEKTVLQVTIEKLLAVSLIEGIVIAVHADDAHYNRLTFPQPERIIPAIGGAERGDSVLCALRRLVEVGAASSDWVLVHDAARPCVAVAKVHELIRAVTASERGGILAVPVTDSLKSVVAETAEKTVSRDGLWLAHTPQMFRVGALMNALRRSLEARRTVTDEASAMEFVGIGSIVVQDQRDNIKITHPEDLALAECILARQNGTQKNAI